MKETLFLFDAAKKTRTSTGVTPTSPSSWRVCHSAMTAETNFLSIVASYFFVN